MKIQNIYQKILIQMCYYISLIGLCWVGIYSHSYALVVETINKDPSHADIIKQGGDFANTITVTPGSNPARGASSNPADLTSIIQQVNEYLWFALAAICMAVLIYGGFKLITGSTDGKKLDETLKLIAGAVIGIAICIFAYMLVRIVVNIL